MLTDTQTLIPRPEYPEPGDIWHQPIEEILGEWNSTDGAVADSDWCADEETEGFTWDDLLEEKRQDSHYDDVVNSLAENGFVRPVTCWQRDFAGRFTYGDGHHRLAAAIDLGMTHVLVQMCKGWSIAGDSGDWWSGAPIPTENRVF